MWDYKTTSLLNISHHNFLLQLYKLEILKNKIWIYFYGFNFYRYGDKKLDQQVYYRFIIINFMLPLHIKVIQSSLSLLGKNNLGTYMYIGLGVGCISKEKEIEIASVFDWTTGKLQNLSEINQKTHANQLLSDKICS